MLLIDQLDLALVEKVFDFADCIDDGKNKNLSRY